MKKNQLKLNEIWSKNKILSKGVHSTVDNEIEILSTMSSSSTSITYVSSTTSSSSSSIPSTSISTPLSSINSPVLATISYLSSLVTCASSTTASSSSSITSTSISMPSSSINSPVLTTIPSSSTTISYLSSSVASSSSTDFCPLLIPIEVEELPLKTDIIHNNSSNDTPNSLPDHDYTSSNSDKNIKKKNLTSQPKYRIQYLTEWEKRPEAQYKIYVFDSFGGRHATFICWLYLKNNSMGCRLCEKYGKRKNSNGKENVWCTTGMRTCSLDKIKLHKEKNEVHKQAEQQELLLSCRAQPGWIATQQKQLNKHELAIQNLMLACIYLCQQNQSLNSIDPLCNLLEKLG
ncbi:unnamed protein product, partial [Rotaria sp. Silwood1]